MVILILGKTVLFWSGILAGIFLIPYLLTCAFSPLKCSEKNRSLFCRIHRKLKWPAYSLILLHLILALLSSLGGIYI